MDLLLIQSEVVSDLRSQVGTPAEVSHQPHAALHHQGVGKTSLSSLSGKIKVKISLEGKIASATHMADDAALFSLV